jgi:ssDNA-binding Zn-finger/Zn-ribbon topoisomerase 1
MGDFRRFVKSRQNDPAWAKAYMHWLSAEKAGKTRLFWKCGNPACAYEYPDGPNATDRCPKCKGEAALIQERPPTPRR